MFVARQVRAIACAAVLFVAFSASACGTSKTIAEEQRVAGRATLGATTLELVVARSGMDMAFGQGQGRGGFLEPAHSLRTVRVYVRVLDGAVERDAESYEKFVSQRLLGEQTWDSRIDDDAIEAWERLWREATLERCASTDDVALRIRPGNALRARWARAHRDASGAVTLREARQARDCAELSALPDID